VHFFPTDEFAQKMSLSQKKQPSQRNC